MANAGTRLLHLVGTAGRRPPAGDAPGGDGALGDLALTATIFAIAFLPIVGAFARVGHWTPGELGLGAAGSLLAGRELWASAAEAVRARRSP